LLGRLIEASETRRAAIRKIVWKTNPSEVNE